MLQQKQKLKEKDEKKDVQTPSSIPVNDNSELLSKLSEAATEETGNDYDSMDDGSSIDDDGGDCGCW